MGLQTIGLRAPGANLTISTAPLDIDSVGNVAGANLIRGVPIRDFGIAANGRPYYKQAGADPSDAAALCYDPNTGVLSLVKRG